MQAVLVTNALNYCALRVIASHVLPLPLKLLFLPNKQMPEIGEKQELQNQHTRQLCSCCNTSYTCLDVIHARTLLLRVKSQKERGTLEDLSTLYLLKSVLRRKLVLRDHHGFHFYVCSFNRLKLATWKTEHTLHLSLNQNY